MNRRQLLQGMAGTLVLGVWSPSGQALPARLAKVIQSLYGDRPVQPGRVEVQMPKLSENGHSVPMTVEVDSRMTEDDHVARITVLAEANPLPEVARFELGQRAGRARVETRIRLADSQRVYALAEMQDGSLFAGHAFTLVTLAACVL